MRISGPLILLLAISGALLWVFRSPDADIATLEASYGNAPSQFITLPLGERVHVRDQGNPDGAVLLLLHGTSASLHTWEPWVAELGDSYRIITMDMPGHGLTGPVPSCDYSIDCAVRLVEDVRTAMGLRSFVIGGNSMGGHISWRYTLAYPQFVRGLILLDASGGPQIKPTSDTLAFNLARIPVANRLLEILTPRRMVAKGLADATSVDAVVTQERIERYWQLARRPGNRKALRLRFTAEERSHLFRHQLADITVPALVLWGKDDQFIDIADGDWFARTLSDVTYSVYDNVGHLPMIEAPKASAADVRLFLDNLPRP